MSSYWLLRNVEPISKFFNLMPKNTFHFNLPQINILLQNPESEDPNVLWSLYSIFSSQSTLSVRNIKKDIVIDIRAANENIDDNMQVNMLYLCDTMKIIVSKMSFNVLFGPPTMLGLGISLFITMHTC